MERNEAIEIVKKNWPNDGFTRLREALETLIPELAKSEDERIRNVLIDYFKRYKEQDTCGSETFNEIPTYKIIDWLEKQGKLAAYYEDKLDRCACENFNKGYKKALEKQDEQKPIEWHKEDEQNLNVCLSYIPDEYLRRWLKDVIHIKYDKPADNIGSKFNVGDWVVSPNGVYWHIDAIRNGRYQVSADSGENADWPLDTNIYHKFTLQDAKDGDVLATPNYIYIFNSIDKETEVVAFYCLMKKSDEHFSFGDYRIFDEILNSVPATKEQCNLLFQKMHEAGYDWYADKKELKKIEQKPADRSERKFEIGDLITNGVLVGKIDEIYEYCGEFYYHACFGYYYSDVSDAENWHKWTIQDAKDGDVLAEDSCIFIIKKMNPNGTAIVHCCLFDDGELDLTGSTLGFDIDSTYPATKEQRDLLFKKMKEAGYEWDAEKKELKEIEQEPENYKRQVMSEMTDLVKDYIKQKPAWSKVDEEFLDSALWHVKNSITNGKVKAFVECPLSNWLKSLKDRYAWKPSDLQIEALESATANCAYSEYEDCLTDLIEQLKKLKG